MLNKSLIVIPFILVGCATTQEPVIKTVIQEVKVPVSVPCKVETPQKPVYNFDKVTPEQDVFEKVKALLADRTISKGYEGELEAALNACTK